MDNNKIFKKTNSLILYELNEVPIRLIKKYVELKPKSAFARLLKMGKSIDTITYDKGELHPWTTWPTLHRGVNNDKHHIQFINQPLEESKKYPPLWDIIQDNGYKIGVFGSLQSYPPQIKENVLFYLPDTFSPDSKAYPNNLKTFQEFNLKVCSENKAISSNLNKDLYFKFIDLLIKRVLSIKSIYKVLSHILKEKLNPKYKTRRSLIQPILGFDLFYSSLIKFNPEFTTFFTNHVAGIIHRYWRDLFPEDFPENNLHIKDNFKKESVIKAMDIADKQINKLMKYCDKHSYNLWVASSMGQEKRKEYSSSFDIQIFDMKLFLESLNLNPDNYKEKPAMQPDICIQCNKNNDLKKLLKAINTIRDNRNNQILTKRYESKDKVVNLSIKITEDLLKEKIIKINNQIKTPKNVGIKFFSRDPGTAYHTPQGILIMYGPEASQFSMQEDLLDTTKIAPMILKIFGIKIPEYMKKI